MKTCIKCGKEFDPAYDFIEDIETAEALIYFSPYELNDICSSCATDLDLKLTNAAEEFFSN